MKRALAFVLLLAAAPLFAEEAKPAAGPAAAEVVAGVEKFLKTPTNELPPDSIEGFLRVDPDTLPAKLQDAYKAKRLELYMLKHMAEGKKKGMMRMPEKTCDVPEETQASTSGVYKAAGMGELDASDVECVQDRTHCSQKEMMCEFTLRIVIETDKKGKKHYHFFMSPNDPLMAIVAACRGSSKDSNFFGSMTPSCLH